MSAALPPGGTTFRRAGASEARRARRNVASDGRGRQRASLAMPASRRLQQGRWGYVLAWLTGVPVPILVVIYLLRGCT